MCQSQLAYQKEANFKTISHAPNISMKSEYFKYINEEGNQTQTIILRKRRACYRAINQLTIENEYDKYIILDNHADDEHHVRRCSYRKIDSDNSIQLSQLFNNQNTSQISSSQQILEDNLLEKLKKFLQQNLCLFIYVNQTIHNQFKEQWNIKNHLPFNISYSSMSYTELTQSDQIPKENNIGYFKALLLSLFPFQEIRALQSPQSLLSSNNFKSSNDSLFFTLCELITLQCSVGKQETFQSQLLNLTRNQRWKQQGQQIKFIQEPNKKKDILNMVQQYHQKQSSPLNSQQPIHQMQNKNAFHEDENSSLELENDLSSEEKTNRRKKSRYHGMSRLLFYSILDLFKPENMANLQVPSNIQESLIKIIKKIKQCGKISIKKNTDDIATLIAQEKNKSNRTDFYNHAHYNALFLICTPTSIRAMREQIKDRLIHKYVFGIDLNNILLEQSKIAFINILKSYSYKIFCSSLDQFKAEIQTSSQSEMKFYPALESDLVLQLQQSEIQKNSFSNNQLKLNKGHNNSSSNNHNNNSTKEQNNNFKCSTEPAIQVNQIRKKYLKRVMKSIQFLSEGVQILRF